MDLGVAVGRVGVSGTAGPHVKPCAAPAGEGPVREAVTEKATSGPRLWARANDWGTLGRQWSRQNAWSSRKDWGGL